MREIRSSGSVGEEEGNDLLYPEIRSFKHMKSLIIYLSMMGLVIPVKMTHSSATIDEPLQLYISAGTHWADSEIFQGMPINVTVSLLNANVRRAEEEARNQWLEDAQQAAIDGSEPPPYPYEIDILPDLLIKVADDNVEWFSNVTLEVERIEPNPQVLFDDVQWTEKMIYPETVEEGEVILERLPIWVTLEISPEMSMELVPGVYQIHASYTNDMASPDTFNMTVKEAETEEEIAILNYVLAEYALKQNNYDSAIAFAQQALNKLPFDNDIIYLTLGDAFTGKGELHKAIDAYEQFLDTYENTGRWGYPQFVRQKLEEIKQKVNLD